MDRVKPDAEFLKTATKYTGWCADSGEALVIRSGLSAVWSEVVLTERGRVDPT